MVTCGPRVLNKSDCVTHAGREMLTTVGGAGLADTKKSLSSSAWFDVFKLILGALDESHGPKIIDIAAHGYTELTCLFVWSSDL